MDYGDVELLHGTLGMLFKIPGKHERKRNVTPKDL